MRKLEIKDDVYQAKRIKEDSNDEDGEREVKIHHESD